jgi:hypothetical protein
MLNCCNPEPNFSNLRDLQQKSKKKKYEWENVSKRENAVYSPNLKE